MQFSNYMDLLCKIRSGNINYQAYLNLPGTLSTSNNYDTTAEVKITDVVTIVLKAKELIRHNNLSSWKT